MARLAPKARKARAQPQAIDWSLAMPTISPFLPSSSLALTVGISLALPAFGSSRDSFGRLLQHRESLTAILRLGGPCDFLTIHLQLTFAPGRDADLELVRAS
jgi:hypothetical protein